MSENGMALEALDAKFEKLRHSVDEQFGGVRKELKELTQALRDLIRLDGDLKRQNDAIVRIGRQVDDHENQLRDIQQVRLPAIEIGGTRTQLNADTSTRFFWIVITAAASVCSSVIAGTAVYLVTH